MEDNIFDQILEVDLKKTMEESYIDYAMSVIASRALPDVRDGLKPVQRRVLFSMIELNNGPDKPHRKCARIVGDTMGKYHPHGDSSIYGALVNMAQDWSFRYPLVDGHGNFGSVDGDGAAAMRYTEARLSKISMEMLADINKDTVDFVPNFDETEKEPAVLPSRFPNLLVNGSSGIAVGMATNIPPHNLREVTAAIVKMIDNRVEEGRETSIDELMEIVKGPDFPTGAQILGRSGIEEAYRTGRGKVRVRAVTDIETLHNGRNRIVVTELPFLVNKARLIEKMAELVRDKKIDGITGITDESSREGMRITIDVRHDANAKVILNRLYKHTQLQDTFGVNMLALVGNQPKVMTLKEMLTHYLCHQEDVVTRRTRYDLNKAQERAHILEGLLIALDHIDEVIHIIRNSANTQTAKEGLIARFALSDAQAQAIVDMRLRALTGLEREKLQSEYAELQKKIEEFKAILADENLLLGVIRKELCEIAEKYGDDRRTAISRDEMDFSNEDLIPKNDVIISLSSLGYIKRMTKDQFRSQNRGGRGVRGMQMLENDYVQELLMTMTHDYLLFFTNTGRVYKLKGYEIPESGRSSRGTAIVNLLELMPGEKITKIISLSDFEEEGSLLMATRKGNVKLTDLSEYANVRRKGLAAIVLREDDELIGVRLAYRDDDVLLITRNGMGIHFPVSDIRKTGRVSMGVIGIRLTKDDEVVSMVSSAEGPQVLSVTEKGLGKRTDIGMFTMQHRAGKGLKAYNILPKTGKVIAALAVDDEQEIMLVSTGGILIRTGCASISVLGRSTSGVKLMNLGEDDAVACAALVKEAVGGETDEEIPDDEEITDEEMTDEEMLPEEEGDEPDEDGPEDKDFE